MKIMQTIEIYWNDLKEEKQKEILDRVGNNCNRDYFPIELPCIVEIEE